MRACQKCKCDCGELRTILGGSLRAKITVSCGCKKKENASKLYTKRHAKNSNTKTKLYKVWMNMRSRCSYEKNIGYHNYGGRGIKVCEEWNADFTAFRDWALANGYSENLTIDRIDVNGNYEPTNCRWVNIQAQCNNRRNNRYFHYNGEKHTIKEWSDIVKIDYALLRNRLVNLGWPIERALTETPHK